MLLKPLVTAALVGASAFAAATPAAAAEIHASLSGAGYADTYYTRQVIEVCDSEADNHAVAVQYYREASASTLRTIWVDTGIYTCSASGEGSKILKARIREQMIAGEDRYGSWSY